MRWHLEGSHTYAALAALGFFVVAVVWIDVASRAAIGQAAATAASSQQQDAPPILPQFGVVSVKLAKPSNEGGMQFLPDGVHITGMVLQSLLQVSQQQFDNGQIVGLPSWANTTRFAIDAKVAPADVSHWEELSPNQKSLALAPLLADRFKLQVHTESKLGSGYALVIAKNGPKLKEAGLGEATQNQIGRSHISMQAATLASAAQLLSLWLGRTVVDKTGLKQKYDLTLDWTVDIDDGTWRPHDQGSGLEPPASGADISQGPSIFTAVQEQLGLKLVPESVPVNVLVVDHVEMPSPN